MALVDVRRLAAVDMYGLAGTRLRRRVILAEFVAGAVGCIVIGLLAATRAASADVGRELRRYTYLELWIVLQLLLVVLGVGQARRSSLPSRPV